MAYIALYRKFRPQTFDQVKGQDHVIRTLKNQIKTGRIGHAYLFTGTRGTGKTTVAKLLARAINCTDPHEGEPCGKCEACLESLKDAFIDIVEIDAASNTGVDDIRRIIDEVRYTPVKGKYKVYIIDEAHMLSGAAFNAFLKTLEEPPSYVVFILATTEPHKLPVTILSRCQRYDFHRIGREDIVANLEDIIRQEGVDAEPKALDYIARMGDGSMRDSVSLLDKCISFNLGRELTYDSVLATLGTVDTDVFSRIFRAVYSSDAKGALAELEKASVQGKDLGQFIADFIWYLRNVLLVNTGGQSAEELLGISKENMDALKEDAAACDPAVLMRYIRIESALLNEIRYSPAKQILIEVSFIRLAKPQMEADTEALADRVRQLESRLASTGGVPQAKRCEGPAQVETTEERARAGKRGQKEEDASTVSDEAPRKAGESGRTEAIEETCRAEGPAQAETQEETDRAGKTAQTEETGANEKIEGSAQSDEPRRPDESGQKKSQEKSAPRPAPGSVCASWDDIISACGPRLKAALKKSTPRDENETGVTVCSPEGVSFDTIRGSADELELIIEKITGTPRHVTVKSTAEQPSGAATIEELLGQINFEIETEDA